ADRNANGGALDAFDTAADDALTQGIYLDELTGDLRVGVVQTAGDASLSTGNVALRTVAGSIVDAFGDGAADVLGQAIDLDANGGSIGTAGDALEIDSLRGIAFTGLTANADDVALEGSTGIYLTETDAYLRLLLAHAVSGNIRITVRESADVDEDLYLVEDGT